MTDKLNLQDRMRQAYYDPTTGYGSAQSLYQLLKKEKYIVSLEDVKKFIKLKKLNRYYKMKKKILYTHPSPLWIIHIKQTLRFTLNMNVTMGDTIS